VESTGEVKIGFDVSKDKEGKLEIGGNESAWKIGFLVHCGRVSTLAKEEQWSGPNSGVKRSMLRPGETDRGARWVG